MFAKFKQLLQMVKDRPTPVFSKQAAAAVVTSATGIVVTLGVLPLADKDKVASMANIVITVVFIAWGAAHSIVALFASKLVTPLADPRADDGTPLVPAPDNP